MMKKFGRFLGILLFTLVFFGCASIKPVVREVGESYTLTLVHTNDHHGRTLSKDGEGGLAERATFIKFVRQSKENVLLLDAGDINTGSALSNMFYAEPDILAYNAMGYDAVTFGNHEFDKSLEQIQNQMTISDFPWLSANINLGKKDFLGSPYIVKDFPGFRVGVIGLTTLRTLEISNPDENLVFTDEIKAAKKYVEFLREKQKCDVIILLGHLGDVEEAANQVTSVKLAESVPGIDIIVDGHAHTKMAKPLVVNGTYIVSAYEMGKVVGVGDLTVVNGKLVDFQWKAEEITSEKYEPDLEIIEILRPFVIEAENQFSKVVLKTEEEFAFGQKLSRKVETPLGNFVADAQVEYAKNFGLDIDFGFINGGYIRQGLKKGDIKRDDILSVVPFENYLYVVTLSGNDVVALFDYIATINQGAGGFPQVSKEVSYTITYDEKGMNGEISDILINGEKIDLGKNYKIAVTDYLADGGDGYEVFTKSVDTFNTSMLISDVVIEYAKSFEATVTPTTDGRITIIGGIDIY